MLTITKKENQKSLASISRQSSEGVGESSEYNNENNILRFEWVKEVPDYIKYFSFDHQIIIKLIGIDNYLILHEKFYGTGIYFSSLLPNEDQKKIIDLIGEVNYIRLLTNFSNSEIYFTSLNALKKAWVVKNGHIDYKTAARTVGISRKTIYNWRNIPRPAKRDTLPKQVRDRLFNKGD
jgi:hypothetical protein